MAGHFSKYFWSAKPLAPSLSKHHSTQRARHQGRHSSPAWSFLKIWHWTL
jgi:hypothetical protein